MNRKNQKGALSIEAALILSIFIVGYVAITTAADFIRAQMIIQHGITQTAKEISAYCYLVSKTGIMEDSYRLGSEADKFKSSTDTVIDTVVKLYDAVDSLERDSYALRKSEKANAYLEAELEVCKMVQKVQDCISEEIRIGVPEI